MNIKRKISILGTAIMLIILLIGCKRTNNQIIEKVNSENKSEKNEIKVVKKNIKIESGHMVKKDIERENSNEISCEVLSILGQSNKLTKRQQQNIGKWQKNIKEIAEKNEDEVFLNGYTKEKIVCLTFDDGPDDTVTPNIINILDKYKVKGNFFFLGENVVRYPKVVKLADESGHLVLSHTYKHKQLDKCSNETIKNEIISTEKIIHKLIGKTPQIMRPPYGATNDAVISVANDTENIIVIWSIDSMDWSQKESSNIVKNILDNVRPGEIILMHSNSDKHATAEALPKVIQGLSDKGFKIVGLDEMLGVQAYK